MDEPILNEHNKQEYPPMHTAEHLLNGEMARRYGCGRAFNAHIERKKSKLDYHLPSPLTDAELRSLEQYVNAIVDEDVAVTTEYITQAEALTRFDLSRLPEGASDTVRVVKVGPYDECPLRRSARSTHRRDRSSAHHQCQIRGRRGAPHLQVRVLIKRN